MAKRVVSLWFPSLASDRALRRKPPPGPFALSLRVGNTERIHCLNAAAEAAGLGRGMGLADARTLCPGLRSAPADPPAEARFLRLLARWAGRYCPWVGLDGGDGLVLDITGSAHLVGGEAALLADLRARLGRAGLAVRAGLADSRGAAWALAHTGGGIAPPGETARALGPLPVSALRLDANTCGVLERLGIASIAELAALPRATVTRRFGPAVLLRLDQALGTVAEQISPLPEPPRHAAQMTLAEPIGLSRDVMAGIERLLPPLCRGLEERGLGARVLRLTLRRVDRGERQVELRLARPMRDPARLLPLFARGVEELDAGFGLDRLRLEAVQVETLAPRQTGQWTAARDGARDDRLDDLITRLGNRVGLENITRFLPADSHIPERGFTVAPAAYSTPAGPWTVPRPRPLRLFAPEPILAQGPRPPERFRWRRMALTTARATGPERIAPEWWLEDDGWRSGLRDYWRVETRQGRRLWLFYTPQQPGWFVQGEFA
ncbi:Y-family DNA polymerase [Acidimangrovimonas pyrenivorans]|uniref:DNA-directed DNA polymerase n=1 Tax=Acidimangrovimonas pyrenivorans TaxID=2030798 RepID=A0ABV7AJP9_9RHOB